MSAIRLALIVVLVMLLGGAARAQQPSKALEEIRETARAYYQARDFKEAQLFYERALPLVIAEYGAQHEQTGIAYYSLGIVAEAARNLAAAERYFRQSVAVREVAYGRDSVGVGIGLEGLGQVLLKQGKLDDAEAVFRRALKIRQDAVGSENAFAAAGHANVGHVALGRGRFAEARASYREATRLLASQNVSTSIVKALADEEIKRFRDTFVGLCRANWEMRRDPGSRADAVFEETFSAAQQAWNTQAASALVKMTARLGAGDTELGRSIRHVQDLQDRTLALNREDSQLLAAWSAVLRADREYSSAADEFRAASVARARDQAPVVKRQKELIEELQALLASCPPGGARKPGCEEAERRREAITAELTRLSSAAGAGSRELMAVHARMEAAERKLPGFAEFTARRNQLRGELDRAERAVADARAQIVRAFPDYAALADPRPLTRVQVQDLLRADEVLAAILVGADRSFVWAITRERADWAQIDLGAEELSREVAALRLGLDPLAQQDAEGADGSRAGVVAGFDLGKAHALYKKVLGPIAPLLSGKRHLILMPTGALTSLPFQVLVTAPPRTSGSPDQALRGAAWLIKSHALSVLPSVPSLGALRKIVGAPAAQRPFFGMGDPVLQGPDPAERQRGKRRMATPARYYRNGLADIRAVRELVPLPDTADELRAIGAALGAEPEAINLREAASETRLKAAPLQTYRVIQFATHGLVAGDLSGLAEPALVLTPPDTPTEVDDGLLTASEIAALKLDADWVVLSACNTAAGQGEGAEALSGLARAFFYAGARTLLVSHWSVYSSAATELTTATFATMAANPGTGRAEAFRQSMLRLIAEGRPPAYWAPFIVVGEGAPVAR